MLLLCGQEGGVLHEKCKKAAISFEKAKLFDIPDYEAEQVTLYKQKEVELEYKTMLFSKSINMIITELRDIAKIVGATDASKIEVDRAFAKQTCGI